MSRGQKGNVLVVRPDSGDPATVVLQLLEIFGEKFGITINQKGYKVLPQYIRILQVKTVFVWTNEKLVSPLG